MSRPDVTSAAVVLDASIVVEWFAPDGADASRSLLDLLKRGRAIGIVSPVLPYEVLHVAGRKWGFGAADLSGIRSRLSGPVAYQFPPNGDLWCRWIEAGLTSYDASYAALAEEFGLRLATEDRQLLAMVPGASTTRALVADLA